MLVERQDLQAGNSVMMGITQLAGFVGPTVAGIIIGSFASSSAGIGLAFAMDAMSFAVSTLCLWFIRTGKQDASSKEESVWTSILAGVHHLWEDRVMRLMFLVLMAVNFLLMGPLLVGIPVLAQQRLPEGATAYGLLMSAFAGGNLIGFLLAGSLPRPGGNVMRLITVLAIASFGAVIGLLGFIPSTWLDFCLLLLLGLGNGYIAIMLFTWMQTRTPKEMLGRIMALVMFSNTGLAPVSQAIAGVACKLDINLMFAVAGGLVLLVTFWMAVQPELTIFGNSLASPELVSA
jgi:hypothetical protein